MKGLKANTSYHVSLRKGSCSNPKTVLAQAGLVPHQRLRRGVGLEVDQQQPDGLGLVGAVREDHRPVHRRAAASSARRSGTTTRPGSASRRYDINLPVVRGPNGYPYCNVAMYMRSLYQPTEPGVTFIYAHARTGMFLPLLNASKRNDGAAMIGKVVYVYTSKSMRYTYKITKVRRHVRDISSALKITDERLWLQTSEGPNSTYPKLIVVAERVASTTVSYDGRAPEGAPQALLAADPPRLAAVDQRIGSGPGSAPSSRNARAAAPPSSTA